MCAFGKIGLVGVEGTGSYGAGLARHLHREGLVIVEVDRPNRQERSRQGKSDALDAIEAARAALSGRAFGVAKSRDGNVEAIRTLMVVRRSARESRTKAINQIRQRVYTAPDELRERLVGVPSWRIAEGVAILRVHADADPVRMATKSALGTLGRRSTGLDVCKNLTDSQIKLGNTWHRRDRKFCGFIRMLLGLKDENRCSNAVDRFQPVATHDSRSARDKSFSSLGQEQSGFVGILNTYIRHDCVHRPSRFSITRDRLEP
jgi:Transposase